MKKSIMILILATSFSTFANDNAAKQALNFLSVTLTNIQIENRAMNLDAQAEEQKILRGIVDDYSSIEATLISGNLNFKTTICSDALNDAAIAYANLKGIKIQIRQLEALNMDRSELETSKKIADESLAQKQLKYLSCLKYRN